MKTRDRNPIRRDNKTQHSNLTRALGGLWAAALRWGLFVVWWPFGLSGQIVCANRSPENDNRAKILQGGCYRLPRREY